MSVHLYLDWVERWTQANEAGLSASERARLEQINRPLRRQQFLAGHGLARRALADQFGGAPDDWVLEVEANQAPSISRGPDRTARISLAHSGTLVVCAVAHYRLGVDCEKSDGVRDWHALGEAVFHPKEKALLASHPTEENALGFRLWCLKEAETKRLGSGLDFVRLRSWRSSRIDSAVSSAWVLQVQSSDGRWIAAVTGAEPSSRPVAHPGERLQIAPLEAWVIEHDPFEN